MSGRERNLWRSLRDSCSPLAGGAPRAVRGARCFWRHAAHTLHGEGSGGGAGRGGAREGAVPCWNTSALSGTRGKQFGSEAGAPGSSSTWRGEGRASCLPISLPSFSASSAPAQRSGGWGDLREAPALWGFLLLSARRGMLGCSCEGVAAAAPGPRCVVPCEVCAPAALSPQGSLVDGRIIDTSLTRDPLVIELGQKQVIPGM